MSVRVRVRIRDSDFIFQSIGEKLQFSVSYFPLQSAVEKLKVRVRVRVRVRVWVMVHHFNSENLSYQRQLLQVSFAHVYGNNTVVREYGIAGDGGGISRSKLWQQALLLGLEIQHLYLPCPATAKTGLPSLICNTKCCVYLPLTARPVLPSLALQPKAVLTSLALQQEVLTTSPALQQQVRLTFQYLPGQFIRTCLKIEQNCHLFWDIFSSEIMNDLSMTFTCRLKVDAKCVYQQ